MGAAHSAQLPQEFVTIKDCNQCGKCCIKYADGGLSATADEIGWWESNRPDIARYIGYENGAGKIWADPDTGKMLTACPWLHQEPSTGLYSCNIYEDRPDDCRAYPVNITEMVVDECEMLEVRDLTDTPRAQQKLDRIMLNSRPPAR